MIAGQREPRRPAWTPPAWVELWGPVLVILIGISAMTDPTMDPLERIGVAALALAVGLSWVFVPWEEDLS